MGSEVNKDLIYTGSCLVMTSRHEGLPMVCLEALSYGMPIALYDSFLSAKDLVISGFNGELVTPFDPVEMVRKIELIISKKEDYSVNALAHAKLRFNSNLYFEKFDSLLNLKIYPFKKRNFKFSIIVPVYNTEPFLVRCLQSIEELDFDKNLFEVIIINDKSPDNSHLIIKDFLLRNSH